VKAYGGSKQSPGTDTIVKEGDTFTIGKDINVKSVAAISSGFLGRLSDLQMPSYSMPYSRFNLFLPRRQVQKPTRGVHGVSPSPVGQG
jgi:hypothetical protein